MSFVLYYYCFCTGRRSKNFGVNREDDDGNEKGEKKKSKNFVTNALYFVRDKVPFGKYLAPVLEKVITYVFFKPNPIIQCMYLLVAGGGFIVYVQVGMMQYCPGPFIAEYHKVTGSIVMFICYYSFYKACTTNPGIISTQEYAMKVKKVYPFDEVMYKKDNNCSTCNILKPARSKHC